MKMIYKLWVELWDNTTFNYLFDTYETIEEWLENHFEKDNKALDIRIEALILCDICNEYAWAECSKLMKKYGQITALCEDCFDHYKINLMRYIKEVK